jgi:hypothetical protein
MVARLFIFVLLLCSLPALPAAAQGNQLCVDRFCIGRSIKDASFDGVDWLRPRDAVEQPCQGIGCSPDVAFKGYAAETQRQLAQAIQLVYGTPPYNLLLKGTLQALRNYSYECNPSPRGIFAERRFVGIFRSTPGRYLTVVGLRLINSELRVYRLAREFRFKNQYELTSLARQLYQKYGQRILLYDYLSSNAYSDVIQQSKDGWFARSSMFNPTDMADNKAELVLIDPRTRPLLEPTSMPDSGEIRPIPVRLPDQCAGSLPLH